MGGWMGGGWDNGVREREMVKGVSDVGTGV